MHPTKPNPVETFDRLRDRVERLLAKSVSYKDEGAQLSLGLPTAIDSNVDFGCPSDSISDFLDFLTDAMPDGDVYLFGGVLRDMAIFGRKGFNSDIDLVVEGDWANCKPYLDALGARINKFGGYRLDLCGWPVDIWNARDTWAIRQGLVTYRGIESLTKTTVLNWDAILMNWRTKAFHCHHTYLKSVQARELDIVLPDNPDPLGMLVRVLRHLYIKDAAKISVRTIEYLSRAASEFCYEDVRNREVKSYGTPVVDRRIHKLFEQYAEVEGSSEKERFDIASKALERQLALST